MIPGRTTPPAIASRSPTRANSSRSRELGSVGTLDVVAEPRHCPAERSSTWDVASNLCSEVEQQPLAFKRCSASCRRLHDRRNRGAHEVTTSSEARDDPATSRIRSGRTRRSARRASRSPGTWRLPGECGGATPGRARTRPSSTNGTRLGATSGPVLPGDKPAAPTEAASGTYPTWSAVRLHQGRPCQIRHHRLRGECGGRAANDRTPTSASRGTRRGRSLTGASSAALADVHETLFRSSYSGRSLVRSPGGPIAVSAPNPGDRPRPVAASFIPAWLGLRPRAAPERRAAAAAGPLGRATFLRDPRSCRRSRPGRAAPPRGSENR